MFDFEDTAALDELLDVSARTFARFGLEVELPTTAPSGIGPLLEAAIAAGYTQALVMPSAVWQHEHLGELATAVAGGDGWAAPYVEVGELAPVGRPFGSYVLLVHHDPRHDDDLRGLTAPALRRALGGHACLTATEYLVAQRTMFDRHGDHRFDDYSADPSGWMWLADSTDGTRTAMGYWNGARARVEVTACKTGSKNPRKGARRCHVVALNEP